MPIPAGLQAPGTRDGPFVPVGRVDDLPESGLLRVTSGDVDVLIARTPDGLLATDDRCPHMSAPLSIGQIDGCIIDCPLHRGRFDLCTGETIQYPTTGGLDADGDYHPVWSPGGSADKPEPQGVKAQARALTRIRRLRYYPLRVVDGTIEVRFPA